MSQEQPGDKSNTSLADIEEALWALHSYESNRDDAGRVYSEVDITNMVTALRAFAPSSIATCPCGDILAIQEKKCDRADCPVVAKSPSATLSSPVRDLLLGLYEARMNGSAEVTNERLKLISDLLGIEAFVCAHPYQQCSRWCGVEARCTVAFKQSSDIKEPR